MGAATTRGVYGVTPTRPVRPTTLAGVGNGSNEDRFVRAPGVLWRRSADVVLARTVADPGIIELGGTGVLLWLALVEPLISSQRNWLR
jgi:hypothetical protein